MLCTKCSHCCTAATSSDTALGIGHHLRSLPPTAGLGVRCFLGTRPNKEVGAGEVTGAVTSWAFEFSLRAPVSADPGPWDSWVHFVRKHGSRDVSGKEPPLPWGKKVGPLMSTLLISRLTLGILFSFLNFGFHP